MKKRRERRRRRSKLTTRGEKKEDGEEKEHRYGLHALCGAKICTVRVRKEKKDGGA